MKGRKPTPNEIKRLRGSQYYDPDAPTADGKPTCPSWMSDYAKSEWRYIVPLLDAKRILDKTDRAALVAYCDAMGRLREAIEALQREMNSPVIRTHNGNYVQNPWVSIRNKAAADVVKWAAELGCTPTARARVQTLEPTNEPTIADLLFVNAK
jgi:P27 family predicted phage terminase small subunit